MSAAWERLTQYASTYHAVVSLDAARTLGVTVYQLQAFARAGHLERRARGVYAVAGSPVTWRQRAMVAAASCSAWASHRAAAALWELDGFPPKQIEVVLPYGTNRRRQKWKVHETRRLSGVDLAKLTVFPAPRCRARSSTWRPLPIPSRWARLWIMPAAGGRGPSK